MTEEKQLNELNGCIKSMHKGSFCIGLISIIAITICTSMPGTIFYNSLLFLFPLFLLSAGFNGAAYLLILKSRKLAAVDQPRVNYGHINDAMESPVKKKCTYYYGQLIYRYPLLKNCILVCGPVDFSNIVRGSKEEAEVVWGNATIKAFGRITPKGKDSE